MEGISMRGRARLISCLLAIVSVLVFASATAGASPWLSLRQHGVGAVSAQIGCTDNGDGTASCETEVLQVFQGTVKVTGDPTLHGQQVCYEKLSVTFDADSSLVIDGHGLFGCALDTGTIRTRQLSSVVLARTSLEVVELSCDASGCDSEQTRTVVVSAKWTGVGRTIPSRGHFRLDEGDCLDIESTQGRAREARFTGIADGVSITSDMSVVAAG